MHDEYIFDEDIVSKYGLIGISYTDIQEIIEKELGANYKIRKYGKGIVIQCLNCRKTWTALKLQIIDSKIKRVLQLKRCDCGKRTKYKENSFIPLIINKFPNYLWTRQFKVTKDERHWYFIDLYSRSLNLAIECDEYNHVSRDNELEFQRESFIKCTLKCNFIRFNPDDKNFSIEKVIEKIEEYIKRSGS